MGIEHDALGKKESTINSKLKGNRNELKVAKLLTAWIGKKFNRTPGSGGLRWIEDQRIAGDVVAPAGFDFPFCIEVKAYKDVEFKTMLRDNSKIYTFFSQAEKDALRVTKTPLLFVRRNGMPANEFIVFFRDKDFKKGYLETIMLDMVEYTGTYESQQSKCLLMGINSEKFINIGFDSLTKALKNE